jgi:hypothetical protein
LGSSLASLSLKTKISPGLQIAAAGREEKEMKEKEVGNTIQTSIVYPWGKPSLTLCERERESLVLPKERPT